MNPRIRNQMFSLLAMTLPLAACAEQATPAAASSNAAPIVSNRSATPAPQLVTGLPDFTALVDQVAPGVVSIVAKTTRKDMLQRAGRDQQEMDDEQVPEFFRRFFGPDFPGQGGQRRQPRGGDDNDIAGQSLGSGFILSNDGYVLTNHHVVDGASQITVKLSGGRELPAKLVGSDEQYDVALLKVEAKDLHSMRIGDSNTVKSGQWVVAIGSPLGLDHSVTAGIVSAVGRSTSSEQRYVPFIQTDVAINQGNSGGPLLNTRGEVIGINSQIFSASGGYMGISFAIPIDLAINAAEQIKSTGRVTRGQLGVVIGPIDALKAEGLGLPDTRGGLVNDLPTGSPAAKAGVEVGDVIRSVNGKQINSAEELPPMIGMMAPGSQVTLGILRDGKARDIKVTLTALNEGRSTEVSSEAESKQAAAPVSVDLLGLQVGELDAAARRKMGLEAGEGVAITAVTGSQARNARLAPGLAIVRVGRTPVGSVNALNRALANFKKGDVVMLLISDGSQSTYVAIKAGG
jgi:serine protease Do